MQMLRFKEMQKDDATKGNTDWMVGWKKVRMEMEVMWMNMEVPLKV